MKLEEIEKMLPNGFHDSLLKSITIDYSKHEAIFDLHIWVGDLYAENAESRETYRRCLLKLYQLYFCVIEAPDPKYPYHESDCLRLDGGPLNSIEKKPAFQLPNTLPKDVATYWFFIEEWNAFIYVAAMSAQLDWID